MAKRRMPVLSGAEAVCAWCKRSAVCYDREWESAREPGRKMAGKVCLHCWSVSDYVQLVFLDPATALRLNESGVIQNDGCLVCKRAERTLERRRVSGPIREVRPAG